MRNRNPDSENEVRGNRRGEWVEILWIPCVSGMVVELKEGLGEGTKIM